MLSSWKVINFTLNHLRIRLLFPGILPIRVDLRIVAIFVVCAIIRVLSAAVPGVRRIM